MTLPMDGTWQILADGWKGILTIPTIDDSGNLGGDAKVFDQPIFGFWDEASRKLTFTRMGADPTTAQIYTGYLMAGQHLTGPTLAGFFEAFAGAGGSARHNVFGWSAVFEPRR